VPNELLTTGELYTYFPKEGAMKYNRFLVRLVGSAVLASLGFGFTIFSFSMVILSDASIMWMLGVLSGLIASVVGMSWEMSVVLREQRKMYKEHYEELSQLQEKIRNRNA
jgi:hypothetical protein